MSTQSLPDSPARVKPETPLRPLLVIANASATNDTSLFVCRLGLGDTADAQTVW